MIATYKIAHAAGMDAGNRLMRKRGLTEWDDECLIRAIEVMETLYDAKKALDN